jgi:hypothetical protein
MKPETKTEPIRVNKNVKHSFTPEEIAALHTEFRQSYSNLKAVECEFDNVKAVWKAKTTEGESRMATLDATLQAGFEMRLKECEVRLRPKDGKKDFFLVEDGKAAKEPTCTEPMTKEDFQQELIQAEAKFDAREEIELFKPTEQDRGVLVVGRLGGKWFSALRVKIGKLELNERLDAEQKCVKERTAAVSIAVKRVNDWAKTNLKDLAKGFTDQFNTVLEAHKERVE